MELKTGMPVWHKGEIAILQAQYPTTLKCLVSNCADSVDPKDLRIPTQQEYIEHVMIMQGWFRYKNKVKKRLSMDEDSKDFTTYVEIDLDYLKYPFVNMGVYATREKINLQEEAIKHCEILNLLK